MHREPSVPTGSFCKKLGSPDCFPRLARLKEESKHRAIDLLLTEKMHSLQLASCRFVYLLKVGGDGSLERGGCLDSELGKGCHAIILVVLVLQCLEAS